MEDTKTNSDATNQILRYTRTAIMLHWLLAMGLIYQLWLGLWMEDVPKTPPGIRAEWFNLHKSIGIVLGLLILLRCIWRLTHRPPTLSKAMPAWQAWAANATHTLLYVCMVTMPLSGFLGSSFTAYPIKFFGTALPRLWEASSELKEIFGAIHTACSYLFLAVISIHIVAALLHVIRRDGIIKRILP